MTRLFPTLLALFLFAFFPPVLRAENEVYGGFGIGYSSFSIDSPNFEAASFATREFLGLRYQDYVALEIGYMDLGTADDQVTVNGVEGSRKYKVESSGFDLSLVGRYPINEELAAFGKLGAIRWDSKATLDESNPLSVDQNGTDMLWGIGLDFRGSGRFHVRVEADFLDIGFANSWWVLTTSLVYGIPFGH